MIAGKHLINLIFIVFIFALFISAANADDQANPAMEKIFNKVKTLLDSTDSYQAIDFINSLGEPDSVAQIYSSLILDFYWKEKNLPAVITIARAGIQYSLSQAEEFELTDPIRAKEIKRKARIISYNLASFTWPGWDEKGIPVGHSDILIGLDAARLNLRLVKELNEGDDKLSVAYWGLGAQLMALQKYNEANSAFAQSKAHARFAGDRMNELLADGYIAINKILSGDENGKKLLGSAIKELEQMKNEDADFFIGQFNTVLNVFIK